MAPGGASSMVCLLMAYVGSENRLMIQTRSGQSISATILSVSEGLVWLQPNGQSRMATVVSIGDIEAVVGVTLKI